MAMGVTEFVLKFGLKSAVEICGEDSWNQIDLSFDQWDSAYRLVDAGDDQDLPMKILVKMLQKSSTSEQLITVYKLIPEGKPLRLLVAGKIHGELKALTNFREVVDWMPDSLRFTIFDTYKQVMDLWLKRLAEVAISFMEWEAVYREAQRQGKQDSDLATEVKKRMVGRAESSAEWQNIFNMFPKGSAGKRRALNYFLAQAKTHDDWFNLWHRTVGNDDSLEKSALEKTVASAATFEDWVRILSYVDGLFATPTIYFYNTWPLAKTCQHLLIIYKALDSKDHEVYKDLKEKTLKEMVSRAQDVYDWHDVLLCVPNGSPEREKALEWLRKFVIMD